MKISSSSESAPPQSAWRRLVFKWYSLILIILLSGAVGYFTWYLPHRSEDVKERYMFATVLKGDLEDLVTASGTLQPRDYVDVGTQVSGQLKKIHVEIGQSVKEGQLLAEIDPTVYLTKVDADRAQLRNQRAQLSDREAQRALAEQQYARQKNQSKEDATTIETLQNAEASMKSARAQVEALRAQIQQTESSLRGDEANLNYTKIYAPMAGTVVSIAAKQGQTVNASQQAPTLLRIADLSIMTVQAQVSEADVRKLRLGMESYFTTLGSQTRRWYSTLRKLEPTPVVQNNVVLYNALFDVPNPNQLLMTQMTAQVFFVVASAEDTLIIPASALKITDRPQRRRKHSEEQSVAPG